MAKKSSIEKNKKIKKLISTYYKVRKDLKLKMKNPNLSDKEFYKLQHKLSSLPRNSSKVRYKNRCSVTGRARGYRRKFGLSRITFRQYASSGLIPGITKSSW